LRALRCQADEVRVGAFWRPSLPPPAHPVISQLEMRLSRGERSYAQVQFARNGFTATGKTVLKAAHAPLELRLSTGLFVSGRATSRRTACSVGQPRAVMINEMADVTARVLPSATVMFGPAHCGRALSEGYDDGDIHEQPAAAFINNVLHAVLLSRCGQGLKACRSEGVSAGPARRLASGRERAAVFRSGLCLA
jgi:hypothetical protein